METITFNEYVINIINPVGKDNVVIRVLNSETEEMYTGTIKQHPRLLDELREQTNITIKKDWDTLTIIIKFGPDDIYINTLLLHTNTIYNADCILLFEDNKILASRIGKLEKSNEFLSKKITELEETNKLIIGELAKFKNLKFA